MANVIKTLSAGDITRKALSILHNKLVFCKTINRQYDSRFAKTGAKNGGTLLIREPNQFTVRTGATMDTQDVSESTQALTVATQKGVDVNFSSVELTLSLDDFSERILDPAMARLAADIEATVIGAVYKDVYNLVGTPGTTPASLATALDARIKLSKGLSPKDSNRNILYDSTAMAATVDALKGLFQSASEIEKQYEEGVMGYAAGFKWLESEIIPNHTNGTRDDTTPLTNAVTAQTGSSLICNGFDASSTIKAGDVFTIADVYAINPETKAAYSHLQQFTVTADATASGGAVTLSISPTITASGAKQTVSTAAANDKALVFVAAGGSGAASTAYPQHLAYHKDAFTFVTADLEMPKDVDFSAREVYDGISLRVVRQFDITNDKFPCRIDVLYGYKTIRPAWATRITG